MTAFFKALEQGYSAEEVLGYISKALPQMSPMIRKAQRAGYPAQQIVGFLSKNFETEDRRGMSESERHAANKRADAERTKYGLQLAATAIAVPLAGRAAQAALSRAIPSSLQGLIPGGAGASPGPSNPTNLGATHPLGTASEPTPGTIPPGTQPQASSSQPPVSPSIPNAPAPAQAQGISNIPELVNKLGLTKHIDEIAKNVKDPKGVAAVLYNKFPKEMAKLQKEAGKPMEDVIAEYMGTQPEAVKPLDIETTPESAPVPETEMKALPGESTAKVQSRLKLNYAEAAKLVRERDEQEKPAEVEQIPEHLKGIFAKASETKDLNELKERMFAGTQEAFGDRDIQRLGRLNKAQGSLNVKEFKEQNPHEWKEAFSQYGIEPQKLGNDKVVIWRAAPKGSEIESGDYVAITKNYADQHLEEELGRNSISRKIVDVNDVVNDAGDPNEWIYAPKKDRDFMSSLSPEKIFSLAKQKYVEKTEEPIKKGSIAASPQGIGEVKEIRNGKTIIEIDGKKHAVNEDELIQSPLPEKDLAELYEDLTKGIEKETGQEISRNVEYAAYSPENNELLYKPHLGGFYVYDDISPEVADELVNLLTERRSTGQNHIGAWVKGTASPIGSRMYDLIKKLQSERGGKGNEYRAKYQTIYGALEPAQEAKKRAYEERKKKAKKPKSS